MLGAHLLEARKRAGLSQHQLAVKMGDRYDRSMIGHVEHGRRGLLLDGAVRAAEVLGVSLDYLVGRTEDPTPPRTRARLVEKDAPPPSGGQNASVPNRNSVAATNSEVPWEQLHDEITDLRQAMHSRFSRLDAAIHASEPSGSRGPEPFGASVATFSGAARPVEVRELDAAAGGGAEVFDETVTGHLWFRRDWLDQHGLDPTQCSVIGVTGDSMEPMLPEGCKILVDRASREPKDNRMFVLLTGDGLVVKELARTGRRWELRSHHPSYPPQPWDDETTIIGEVRWSGRVH